MVAWKDVADTLQAFATAGGIVVGGVFTYYKFVKDRIYRPRVDLDLTGEFVEIGSILWLVCSVNIGNKGTTKLQLMHTGTAVIITPALDEEDARRAMHWDKTKRIVVDAFAQHDWIESTEIVRDEIAVQVSVDRGIPLHLQFRLVVAAPSPLRKENIEIWTSRIIAPRDTSEPTAHHTSRRSITNAPASTGRPRPDA
jgi:hypothetical protein